MMQLKVQENIWKGEYVEIFSLLQLEKFTLVQVGKDEDKKGTTRIWMCLRFTASMKVGQGRQSFPGGAGGSSQSTCIMTIAISIA